jgi:hypothetical protein
VCAQCHASVVATQSKSAMAQTSVRTVDSRLLKEHANELNFPIGPYSYAITYSKDGVTYSAHDATSTISGHAPTTLEKALGIELSPEQRRGCFDCHATAATTSERFDPE